MLATFNCPSLVPRPLPDKIWEWPGDEATIALGSSNGKSCNVRWCIHAIPTCYYKNKGEVHAELKNLTEIHRNDIL